MTVRQWAGFAIVAGVWGSTFLWITVGLKGFSPFFLVSMRIAFGWLLLLVIVLFQKIDLRLPPLQLMVLIFLGLSNLALPMGLITWGQQYIDSGIASILNSSQPLWALILAHFALREEHLTWRQLLGVLIGFAGVALIISQNRDIQIGSSGLWGYLAVLGAAVSFASSAVIIRRFLPGVPPVKQVFLSTTFAYPWAIGLALLTELPLKPPTDLMPWVAVIWLGVLGIATGFFIYYWLINAVGAVQATTVTYAVPIVGVLLGISILKEHLSIASIFGMILVIAGIYVSSKERKP